MLFFFKRQINFYDDLLRMQVFGKTMFKKRFLVNTNFTFVETWMVRKRVVNTSGSLNISCINLHFLLF